VAPTATVVCGPCGQQITLLGGIWTVTAGDQYGEINCMADPAPYAEHQPVQLPEVPATVQQIPAEAYEHARRVGAHLDDLLPWRRTPAHSWIGG
jgi:hypothetical protein